MTALGDIDWGDHPDWRERLAAARKPRSPEQRRWDAHFDQQLRIVRRTERDPTNAIVTAFARTEDQYGNRPDNEETT